ncbi:phage tail assembly protein [Aurantimonas coralicida]|uniref:phage tail assembly protein n=1 Tax=Aurantimonas coralicida TaxID=182270 RepID=UPI001D193794|nr:phage tail assembly protein [Aurantimonas coralicida]MCC4298545.1 phage tail assembly protein [Aurantimonas coralicida]
MPEVRIPLSRRYDHGTTPFDTVVLREPKLKDRRAGGPILDIQRGVVLRDDEAIWRYVSMLLVEPVSPGAIDLLDLADAEILSETIVGFFTKARLSSIERTNSSSASDGTPDASKT